MSDQHLPVGLNFKKSNIRIWIHQRNMANLQQVIWEGQGGLLLVEHSNNPKMKKFLEAVPHIMVSYNIQQFGTTSQLLFVTILMY